MNKYKEQITGPVIPIPTPFNKDESVDYKSLGNYVRFLVSNGIKNIMTTVGTSRFNLLTKEEIKKVNQTIVEAAEGKINTIVANPPYGSLKEAIEFGKHAEAIGADLYLAYYPERHYGDDYIIDFFNSISNEINIGILIHEMPMRNGLGGGQVQYSIKLLNKLLDIENVVGLKEEALDMPYSNQVVKSVADRAVVIGAGGGMSRYLRDYWLGARAFLGGVGNFNPKTELDFYDLFENKEFEKAHQVVNEIEAPFFAQIVPFGWHTSLKAMLSLNGHMQPFERKPMKQTTKTEKEKIKEILASNNWLKNA